jgi:ketosteroid isomerase-like protein
LRQCLWHAEGVTTKDLLPALPPRGKERFARDTAWAMSEENVRLVRESYTNPGASGTGSSGKVEQRVLFAAWAERVTPNTKFDFTMAYPDRPVMHGLEEVRRFREEGPWEELSFQPERFVDVDDERVLVLVLVYATGKGSGIPVELRNAHEFTIRDGVLVRFKVYSDRDEALEAAGLSE